MFQVRKAVPTVVTTPLPSKEGAEQPAGTAKPQQESPYLRAANEDDDGYDPYSDRREEPPLFERNPWD